MWSIGDLTSATCQKSYTKGWETAQKPFDRQDFFPIDHISNWQLWHGNFKLIFFFIHRKCRSLARLCPHSTHTSLIQLTPPSFYQIRSFLKNANEHLLGKINNNLEWNCIEIVFQYIILKRHSFRKLTLKHIYMCTYSWTKIGNMLIIKWMYVHCIRINASFMWTQIFDTKFIKILIY